MNISVVTKIADFIGRNHKTIEKAGLIGAEVIIGGVLATRYDIPLNFGGENFSIRPSVNYDDDFDFDDLSLLFKPKNATTTAILSTTQHAKSLYFDSNRMEAVRDIYKLASKEGTDDDTKEYAVLCMNKIREMMDYDSRKREVQRLILKLLTE